MPTKRQRGKQTSSGGLRKVQEDDVIVLSDDSDKIPVSSAHLFSDNSSEEDDDDYDDPTPEPKQKRRRINRGVSDSAIDEEEQMVVSNIDDIDDFIENPLFEDLSDPNSSISQLAQSWINDFTTEDLDVKFNALKDFINLLLRLSGCTLQLSKHDVEITDSAKDTITDVQLNFKNQKFHEFPLLSPPVGQNAKDWKLFPENVSIFFENLIDIAGENGSIYNDEFIGVLFEWISVLSTSNIRSLRYVATFASLRIENKLCSLITNLIDSLNKSEKQLMEENTQLEKLINSNDKHNKRSKNKIEIINKRIKQIELNVENFRSRKEKLTDLINEIFNTIFIHRYRDVSNEIRYDCIKHLGIWMNIYPEFFFDVIYMRYLGWTMTDLDPLVRSEAFKILTKLYKRENSSQSLKQFTEFFKLKLINISIYESDSQSRLNCIQLLIEIIKRGLLSNDEIIQIVSLIYLDNEDILFQFQGGKLNQFKFLKELAILISTVEELRTNNQSLIDSNNSYPINIEECLKIKSLVSILEESFDYYLENYSFKKIKENSENSKFEKISKISQYIYQLNRYNKLNNESNEMFEIYLNYLTFDFYEFKELKFLELDTSKEIILLNFIIGSSQIYLQGNKNQFNKILFSKHNDSIFDNNHYLSKLTNKLETYWSYFKDDIEKLTLLIYLIDSLLLNNSIDQNQNIVKVSNNIIGLINKINFLPIFELNSLFFESISFYSTKLLLHVNPNDGIYREEILKFNHSFSQNIMDENISTVQLSRLLILISNEQAKPLIFNDIGDELLKLISIIPMENEILNLLIKILDSYINYHLTSIYKQSLNNPNVVIPTSLKFSEILNKLTKFINCDSILELDTIQNISNCYISNILSIEAFKLENERIIALSKDLLSSSPQPNSLIPEILIDSNLAERILKLFCIREFQIAQIQNFDNKLERDEMDDVNFDKYIIEINSQDDDNNNDDDDELKKLFNLRVNDYSKQKKLNTLLNNLCELSGKLLICDSFNLFFNKEISNILINRLKLNQNLLGDNYSKVLNQVDSLNNVKLNEIQLEKTDDNFFQQHNDQQLDNGDEFNDDPLEVSDSENEVKDAPIQNENTNINSEEEEKEDDMEMEFSNIEDVKNSVTSINTQSTLSSID